MVFEVMFASIAAILAILSLRTLIAIRRLGVGKSFWLPVLVSSVLFILGSAVTILWELKLGFFLTAVPIEVVEASRILALCVLVGGVYSYSKRIKGSLNEEFTIPEQLFKERLKIEPAEEDNVEPEASAEEERVPERPVEKDSGPEPALKCPHHLGYLRTLARDRPIPDECLHCDKIIECKYSPVEASESRSPAKQVRAS